MGKITYLLSWTNKSLTGFSANNSIWSMAIDKGRLEPTAPDTKQNVRLLIHHRHSTRALMANCQLSVLKPQQHFPSPSLVGLKYAWHNIFFQSTERDS